MDSQPPSEFINHIRHHAVSEKHDPLPRNHLPRNQDVIHMFGTMVVSLPEEELDRIHRVASPPYRAAWAKEGWQAILSCNPDYEVWPTVGYGKTALKDREYLDIEDFPALESVVAALLRRKRLGGRIFVRDDMLFYSPGEGKEELCRFGVVTRSVPLVWSRP